MPISSLAIEASLKAEIEEAIKNEKAKGKEMDFSKWMRDAAKKKLKSRRKK